jgi:dCMP deaminase|tara:strand:+ start:714 stop:1160 length:447 start_codon:yes stop_codon:yes gene_type:complete
MNKKWKKRYLKLAKEISTWSKDPSTKVGAIIVGSKGQVISQGYNGFPRGVFDDIERYENREDKLKYVVHAEANAIYNAAQNGSALNGSYLFVHGLPVCNECAKAIIQVGIKHIIVSKTSTTKDNPKWKKSFELTKQMFEEADIEIEVL